MENEEVAEALGISLATVKRDWAVARAWLHRELSAT
jgi:DNA-directed RNA polymerase specialized sigma24 family protein